MAAPAPADPRLTVSRYFALVDDGVLRPDDRIELLEGVVVSMSPQNPRHAVGVTRAAEALWSIVRGRAVVRVQLPFIAGPFSVPEPDVAVVPLAPDEYTTRHPSEALLIVEVADTSLLQDRSTKAAIYAGAGVPEYLIVDVSNDHLELHRDPDVGHGRYREVVAIPRDASLSLALLGMSTLDASVFLPPARP